MNPFFKRGINIMHTYRDYESEFSSKNDVFLPEGENLYKYRRIKTLYGKIIDRINDRDKNPSKNGLKRYDGYSEQEFAQDDPLHAPANAIFHFHGKRYVFCKKSMFGLDQDSSFRRFAVFLTESIYFEFFTVILIIFNSVLLGLKNYQSGARNGLDDFYDIIEPIVLAYNLLEAILRSAARGFNVDENSYIRQNMNAIDFCIAVTGFTYVLDDILRYFSILRLPRVVIFLEKFKLFKTISDMTSLIFDSILPLSSVFLMILFFYSIFAILGLHIYVGSLSSRCKYTAQPTNNSWISDPNITRLCGEEYHCPKNEYCGSVFDYQSEITGDLSYDLYHPDFNYGLTNFDTFPNALFTVFIINHGSWTNLLINLADSKTMVLAVIYCTVNYLVCNIFVFQIAVAVMLDNFERKRNRKKPGIAKHLERTERIDEKANSLMKKFTLFQKNCWRKCVNFIRIHFPSVTVPESDYYKNPIARKAYLMSHHNLYRYSMGTILVFNLIALCFDSATLDDDRANFIKTINAVCVYINLVEVIIKIMALSFYEFILESFNIFELIIAIGSVIEISQTDEISVLSVLRGFKLLRHLKDEYEWNSFRVLAIVLFDGLTHAIGFIIILGLYIYCFAVIGMKYFAGTFIYTWEDGMTPRANFDSLKEAYTSVFQILVGENFNQVVFSAILALGWSSIIYFVMLVVTGKFLLLQMFLAVILGNFEEAREKVSLKKLTAKAVINRIMRKRKIKRYSVLEQQKKDGQVAPAEKKHTQSTSHIKLPSLMLRHQVTLKEAANRGFINDYHHHTRSRSINDEVLNNYQNYLLDEPRRRSKILDTDAVISSGILAANKLFENASNPVESLSNIPGSNRKLPSSQPQVNSDPSASMPAVSLSEQPSPALKDRSRKFDNLVVPEDNERDLVSLEASSKDPEVDNKDQSGNEMYNGSLEIDEYGGDEDEVDEYEDDNQEDFEDEGKDMEENDSKNEEEDRYSPRNKRVLKTFIKTNSEQPIMKKQTAIQDHEQNELKRAKTLKDHDDMKKSPIKKESNFRNENANRRDQFKKTQTFNLDTVGSIAKDIEAEKHDSDPDLQRQDSGGPDAHVQMTIEKAYEKIQSVKHLGSHHGKSFVLAKSSRIFPEERIKSTESLMGRNPYQELTCAQFIMNRNESSLFVLHKSTRLRINITSMMENALWDHFMIGAIFINAILLILDSPLNDPDSLSSNIYRVLGAALTSLFTVEMGCKILAYGFLFNSEYPKRAYIRDPWNILDFVVVVISLIDLASGIGTGVQGLKSLRALRALRPLRVIRKYHGLRLIVNALFKTIQALQNFLVVAGLLMGICALIAIELFKGSFYSCSITTVNDAEQCVNQGGIWGNAYSNYDNIGNSLLLFLQMVAGGDYIQTLYSAVDSRGQDLQPQEWSRPFLLVYCYLFMVVANILILNTFIGFSIENFREIKEELIGLKELNIMQREWVEMQTSIQRKNLKTIIPEPTNKFSSICFQIMNNHRFDNLMAIIVVFNMVFLCMRYAHQPDGLEFAIELVNYIFLGIFHIEFVIKISGSATYYFKDIWNRLDFLILVVTDIFLVLKFMNYLDLATIPTVFRMMRMGKMVKNFRKNKSVQILIDTIYSVLPSLGNIVFLMMLLMFIYGILGMNLFAQVKYQEYISEAANFRSLISALNILARTAVGQDWSFFMLEVSNPNIQGCVENQSYSDMQLNGILGCGSILGYPYFLSYIFLVTLILIYLFLAIVTGGYTDSKKESDAVISPSHWDEFIDKWAEYDPLGTGFITPEQLAFLVHDLPPPIGVKDDSSIKFEFDIQSKKVKGYLVSDNKRIVIKRKQLYEDMVNYDVPVYAAKIQELTHGHIPIFHTKIHISDVCKVVCYNAINKKYENREALEYYPCNILTLRIHSEHVLRNLAKGWVDKFSVLKRFYKDKQTQGDIPLLTVSEFFAGTSIAIQWKKYHSSPSLPTRFREEKRLQELQRLEKGLEYEGFQYQQRLANLAPKRLTAMATPVRRDVKRTSTVQNKKSTEFDLETKKTIDEEKTGLSGEHDVSLSSMRKRKRADTQLDILKRYRERNNDEGRQETQETADEEYWLVSVPDKMRYPVPYTKEVDKCFLDALDGNKIVEDNFGKSPMRRGSMNLDRRPSELFAKKVQEIISSRKSSLNLDRRSSSASIRNSESLNQSIENSIKDALSNNFMLRKSKFNEDLRKESDHDIVFQPPPQPQRNADLNISSDILVDESQESSDSSDTTSKNSKVTSEAKIPTPKKKSNPKILDSQKSKESDQLRNSVQFRESIRFKENELSPPSNLRESQILKDMRESQRLKDSSNPLRESYQSLKIKEPESQQLSESFELRKSQKKHLGTQKSLPEHIRNKSQHEKTLSLFEKNATRHERKVSQVDKTPSRHQRIPSHQTDKAAPVHSKTGSLHNKTGSLLDKSPKNHDRSNSKHDYNLLTTQKSIPINELLAQNESGSEDDDPNHRKTYGRGTSGRIQSQNTVSSHEIIDTLESERQNLATETDQLDP